MVNRTDQFVRHAATSINRRYGIRTPDTVWDSLIIKGHEDLSIVDVSKLLSTKKQLKRLPSKIKNYYIDEIKDSDLIWIHIDSINKYKLYKIIKKYGYPSYDLRKWKNDSLRVGIASCLTHYNYDSKFGIKFFNLIVKEYKKNRIDKDELRYLIWSYEGRTDDSIGKNTNVDEWIEKYLKTKK